MWLIKLPFRILALPIMAVVAVLSIFYSLALNLSAMVAGLVYLVLGVCIVMLLFQHAWIYAALLFGFAVLVFLAIMFAEAVSLGLEALTGMQFTELSGRCSVFERPLSDAKRPLFF